MSSSFLAPPSYASARVRSQRRAVSAQAKRGFGAPAKPPKVESDQLRPHWEVNKGACPCESGQSFQTCCEPFIKGKAVPGTPEQLMRSRFSCYALRLGPQYIVATTHADNPSMKGTVANGVQKSTLKEDVRATMDVTKYLRLVILEAPPVDDSATEAFVKFRVWFKFVGQKMGGQRESKMPIETMTEKSKFVQVDGQWYYREATECDWTAHVYKD